MMSSPYDPQDPYAPPKSPGAIPPQITEGDATGGIIPYKNPPALIAYYLGLFSMFPCIGFFLAVPAFILGIIGLQKRRHNPVVRGSVHAWIGIVMGGLFAIIWGAVIVTIVIGMVGRAGGGP